MAIQIVCKQNKLLSRNDVKRNVNMSCQFDFAVSMIRQVVVTVVRSSVLIISKKEPGKVR